MPTKTYEPIATATLNGSTASYTFSSIPSTYTDLILVQSLPGDPSGTYGYSNYRVNSDTGSNYNSSYYYWYNAATYGRQTSSAFILNGTSSYLGNTNIITHIQNYSNSTTYKSLITRANFSANSNGVPQEIWESIGVWRSTAAINSVTAYMNTGNYSSGSTLTLYGII